MASTKINVGAVIGLSSTATGAKTTVTNIKSSFNTTRRQIDGKILNRSNLANRFQNVYNTLGSIETKVSRIKSMVENGANWYHDTDQTVLGWSNDIVGNFIAGCGSVGAGTGIPSGAALEFEKIGRNTGDDSKVETDSTFKQVLKDDWKIEGAVLGGSVTGDGEFLGVSASGTAEGELIGGSVSTKSKANWDLKDKDAGIEKSITAEGHLAKGSLEGNYGILGGKVEGTVGSVSATGSIGASLYKDGKFSPALEAELKGKAAVAEGEAEIKLGNDEFNGHVNAEGTVLGAEAELSGGAGMITYKDETTGKTKTELGVSGKAGAEAYLAEGSISGGFTIFGIEIDVGVSGKAGGAGVEAGGRVTTGGISGEIGAGLGLGLGLELSIDWSDFSLW